MNQISPMNTATAAGATAIITPPLVYFLGLAGFDPPAEVISCLAVILVTGAHWLGDFLSSRKTPSSSITKGASA